MYMAAYIRITKGGIEIICEEIIQVKRQYPSLNTIVCLNGSEKELAHLTVNSLDVSTN